MSTESNFSVSDDKKLEFFMIEYKESSAAYFKGVDIGVAYIKLFLLINGILLAATGLKGSALDAADAGLPAALKGVDIASKAPWVGLLFSLLLAGIGPYYRAQLSNCSSRCAAIEEKFGGLLFTKIHATNEHKDRRVTATGTIFVIALLGAAFWLYLLYSTGGLNWIWNALLQVAK